MLADLQRTLADVVLANGETDEAIRLAESAAAVYETDVELYRNALMRALAVLAAARIEAGQPEMALASVNRAVEISAGTPAENDVGLNSLAMLAMAMSGDCQTALSRMDAVEQTVASVTDAFQKQRVAARIAAVGQSCSP